MSPFSECEPPKFITTIHYINMENYSQGQMDDKHHFDRDSQKGWTKKMMWIMVTSKISRCPTFVSILRLMCRFASILKLLYLLHIIPKNNIDPNPVVLSVSPFKKEKTDMGGTPNLKTRPKRI